MLVLIHMFETSNSVTFKESESMTAFLGGQCYHQCLEVQIFFSVIGPKFSSGTPDFKKKQGTGIQEG